MRRAVLPQPVVIAPGSLTPAEVGVITRLVGQHGSTFVEFDGTVIVSSWTRHPESVRRPFARRAEVAALSACEPPDEVWRQPGDRLPEPDKAAADERYDGPPATVPPAPDWQPPLLLRISAPRMLPALDQDAIDEAEQRARRLTYGFGYGAAAVLLIMALARVLL